MEKILKIMVISLVVLTVFLINNVKAAPNIPAESCAYEHVKAAYDLANEGDTIVVPAGSATWSSTLNITKGIILTGSTTCTPTGTPGTKGYSISCDDQTVITADSGLEKIIEIDISLSTDTRANQPYLKISGFTFKRDSKANYAIKFNHYADTYRYKNFRIYHNKFYQFSGAVYYYGDGYGLIDHNFFDSCSFCVLSQGDKYRTYARYKGSQDCSDSENPCYLLWDDLQMGTDEFLYVEDNYAYEYTSMCFGNGQGGRTVFRYNTATHNQSDTDSLVDFHGASNTADSFAGEAYGNCLIRTNSGPQSVQFEFLQFRGLTHLMYNNDMYQTESGLGSEYVKIMCSDCLYPPGDCSFSSGGSISGYYYSTLQNCYLWNNNYEDSMIHLKVTDTDNCITSGTHYWADTNDNSRNAQSAYAFYDQASTPGTCTIGDVFWDTDEEHGEGYSTGALYKCTAANTWTWIYSPYTYPHPLSRPEAPSGLKVVQ